MTEEVKNEETGEIEVKVVNTLNKICDSVAASRDYLTHKNEPEHLNKYVYDTKDVIEFGNGWSAFNKTGRCADDCLELLDRMLEGATPRELARDYGRDVIINFHKYKSYALMMECCEENAKDVLHRENDIIRRAEKDKDTDWYYVLDQINVAKIVESVTATILREIGGKH